jgi:AraC-like DNA-binding protein
LHISTKRTTFAGDLFTKSAKIIFIKMANNFEEFIKKADRDGIAIEHNVNGWSQVGKDVVLPYVILLMTRSGSARALYDMVEVKTEKPNELFVIMPGHVMHPIEHSDDYTFTRVFISPTIFEDLRFALFSHDYDKFHHSPLYALTDEQREILRSLVEQLERVLAYSPEELPHRKSMLTSILAVYYEYLNLFRRELDKRWKVSRHNNLFNQFCDLVVAHYRESREVQFYAEKLHLTPKYFSKIIREVTDGLSPADWIEQYIVAQAQQLLKTHPNMTVQEIAYMLGFNEPASFCRYYKRVTGSTAKQYRHSAIKK